ncbi:MAG: hypothetical protein F6K03_10310 [Kamptonema sp. SIO4C4]|nr:hypothetical protein [Kamptonema sp. SIO4C4]
MVENLTEVSIGLGLWLFFLLAFVMLGYPILMSIFLGALAGLSGGWIVAWWKDDTPPPKPSKPKEEAKRRYEKRKRNGPGIFAAQKQRRVREKRSPRGRFFLNFPWPFNRRNDG